MGGWGFTQDIFQPLDKVVADRLGIIRLKESPYYQPELRLDDFMSALQELFPSEALRNQEKPLR
jgi:hypothetical protein